MDSAENSREQPGRVALEAHPEHPRILVLSIVNPEIERNGASTVTRGLLRSLELPPLRASVECIPVRRHPRRFHRSAQALSLIRASRLNLPSKAVFLRSREFIEKVEARLRHETFDLVVLNGSDLLWISEYLPRSLPRVLVAHNIEHLLFDSQIRNLGGMYRPLRGWLRRDARRLRDFEIEGMRAMGNVVFLSEEDAAYARRHCRDLRALTIPPLFDYTPGHIKTTTPGPTLRIGCVGNFGWWPNRQGLRWFVSRVLPHVTSPVCLHLFGPGSDRAWRDPRVVGHGVVADMSQIWAQTDFLICPSFAGGGVCVKVAEAAWNRMPILATRHAARGLPLSGDPAIVLADDPAEWIGFLNSTEARALARRQVSEKNAARFALTTYFSALQDLVRISVQPKILPQEA